MESHIKQMLSEYYKVTMRHACGAFAAAVVLAGCAAGTAAGRPEPVAEPLEPGIAVATFDSLWSMVRNTYVDTAFVSSRWMAVRDTLRPRAEGIREKRALDALLHDAVARIPDSHFYIIPAHVATEETAGSSDGRGSTGLQVRIAEGNVVAWKVDAGSAAARAGISAGQRIARMGGRDTDSALKRVNALPEVGRPRALASMLQGLNALLAPSSGDTATLFVAANGVKPVRKTLVAGPALGLVSQFGNLPPLAGHVTAMRVPAGAAGECVGVIGFNIWLPALTPELERAVDSVRSCAGVVIDLRGNPGGVGAMVMGFGGYFVDSTRSLGTMRTRQVSLNFVINPRTSRPDGRTVATYSGPMAILVDPMTASTSEIFATGMQRIGRARVFGERSAGAALPALMERLPSGDVFVHAVADFTDPRGQRVEGAGAVPDEMVPLSVGELSAGRDGPLDAAISWILGRRN